MSSAVTTRLSGLKSQRLSLIARQLVETLGSSRIPVGTVVKWVAFLVFLFNIRSWPLVWHYRVFAPVVRIKSSYHWMRFRTILKSRSERIRATEDWYDSISPVGADPFETGISYHSWASIDDSDFNGHLSNSSYPKTLDCARMKAAIVMFPQFLRAGGRILLAGTHFNFIREIPIFASYEVRVSMGSWDQKWVYVLSKFVTKPKRSRTKVKREERQLRKDDPKPESEGPPGASLSLPVDTTAQSNSPMPSLLTPSTTANGTASETAGVLNEVSASLASSASVTTEPDGAIVHTIAVSVCCFKSGRITVPPALVLALNGFSGPAPLDATSYSPSSPPSHWEKVKGVVSATHGGGPKKIRDMLKGGWRDIPEGERWWDAALSGNVEERRRDRLEVFRSFSTGMSGVREF